MVQIVTANQFSPIGPQHAWAAEFVETVGIIGPLGGGELYRTLLTYLDGGGIGTLRAGPSNPQQRQEQGLEFDEKQWGNNAATLSVTAARKAASKSISSTELAFCRTFMASLADSDCSMLCSATADEDSSCLATLIGLE
jgi:hypothetical protein